MNFEKFHKKSIAEFVKKAKSPPKRKPPVKIHEPVYASNFMIKTCRSPEDYVDRGDWEEEDLHNMVFIKGPGKPNGIEEYWCFRKRYEAGPLWTELQKRRMAKWIQNPAASKMDAVGYGGMPSKRESDQYVLLFPNNDLLTLRSLEVLRKDRRVPSIYVLNPLKDDRGKPLLVRYGNVEGSFGVSQLHGQHDPQPVYELIRSSDPRAHVSEEKEEKEAREPLNMMGFNLRVWDEEILRKWVTQVHAFITTIPRGHEITVTLYSCTSPACFKLPADASELTSIIHETHLGEALSFPPLPYNTESIYFEVEISDIPTMDKMQSLLQILGCYRANYTGSGGAEISGSKKFQF